MAQVLVVEDDAIIAEDLRRSLKRMGHDVPTIARSSEEALRAVEAARPQLILMDIKLKGSVDGIATAAMIRRRDPIPLIYLTSHSDTGTLARARCCGERASSRSSRCRKRSSTSTRRRTSRAYENYPSN